jgi:hypothetical protein
MTMHSGKDTVTDVLFWQETDPRQDKAETPFFPNRFSCNKQYRADNDKMNPNNEEKTYNSI